MKILTTFGFLLTPNDRYRFFRNTGRISQQFFLVMLIIPSVRNSNTLEKGAHFLFAIQILAVLRSLNEKNMQLTLRAFYYLSIQLYITCTYFSTMANTNGLRKLFGLLEENMAESK